MRLTLLLFILVLARANAELSTGEKSILLDAVNYYRATAAQTSVRFLDWSTKLAGKAQAYVSACDAVNPPPGLLQFYNSTRLPGDGLTRVLTVVEQWVKGGADMEQLYSRQSTHVGCGTAFCDRLPATATTKIISSQFYACWFDPRFFKQQPYPLSICRERGVKNNCPSKTSSCVEFPKARAAELKLDAERMSPLCSNGTTLPQVPTSPETTPPPAVPITVTYLSPRYGSLGGGQKVTIYGTGFSSSNFDGANEVVFIRGSERIPCDVVDYSSSSVRIVCVTRPVETLVLNPEIVYSIEVSVTIDGKSEQVEATCQYCTYTYHYYSRTPLLRNIKPLAGTFGETVLMEGWLYANTFEDVDEDEDVSGNDHFTRILVGGQLCDHMPNDDTMYKAILLENKRDGSIECLPSTGFSLGSMNASFFLEDRGQSLIPARDYLTRLDNKFQPYDFQTHADILDVSPRFGSRAGGTKISITLNTPLVNYTDINTIRVKVGGVLCEGVALVASTEKDSIVECTTGPQQKQTTYYPGGRGLLREVWNTGYANIPQINSRPRASNATVDERTFLHSDYASDFGQLKSIVQRLSGFFVPPVTSLYTFQIRSDDSSTLYLSPDSSSDDILDHEVAVAPQHTRNSWTYFPSQTSEPILLEEGKYYYFMMPSNQGSGPWEMGIGAKVHNLSYSSYPYDSDSEEQRIAISSTTVKEEHMITIEGRPSVKKITLTNLVNASLACEIPLQLTGSYMSEDQTTPVSNTVNITITPSMSVVDVEDMLNQLNIIQRVGSVKVIKDLGGSAQFGEGGSLDVQFTLVFLAPFGVGASNIPDLSLATGGVSGMIACIVLNGSGVTAEYSISSSIQTVQGLVYPDKFNVGFELEAQPHRYTPSLQPNATTDIVRDELSNLFAWQCDSDVESLDENGHILFHADYESSSESNRDNETAFCGHYSEKNPRTVWNAGTLKTTQYRYVCFAYKGTLPNLRVLTSYTEIQLGEDDTGVEIQYRIDRTNVNTRLNSCTNWPFTSVITTDGWSDFECIDIRTCLEETYDMTRDHEISKIWFSYREQFWIDEFVIAKSDVSVTRRSEVPPISPNGISVRYVEVDGGVLQTPTLSLKTTSDLERDYSIVLSTFRVTYTVRDCGNGMEPIVGYYNQTAGTMVDIEQVVMGTGPVTGTFDLSFGDTYIRDIPSDVEAHILEMLMEATFVDQGGFSVKRLGDCSGYSWNVRWEKITGDVPLMSVAGDNLEGVEPMISVETVVDGGTWLRPIGGDMLRLPLNESQVEVIVNDIPSSCRNGNCAFTFADSATPTVQSVSPLEGQGGDEITIYGVGFTDNMSSIVVRVGASVCTVSAASTDEIKCVLSNHPAGFYKIYLAIEGSGAAAVNSSACFHYLLSVDAINPSSSGVGGGAPIMITGMGFLAFSSVSVEGLGEPVFMLPWFRYGFGLPSLESPTKLGLCSTADNWLSDRRLSEQYSPDNRLSDRRLSEQYSPDRLAEIVKDVANRFVNSKQSFESLPEPFQLLAELADCNSTSNCESNFKVFNNGSFVLRNLVIHLLNLYYHFPSYVIIGETPCIITESSVTQLTCVPVVSTAATVNVTVTVFSDTQTLTHEVSLSASPQIASIEPLLGAVSGETVITISGTNFGASSQEDTLVTIGGSACNVTFANDSYVQCVSSPHRPGYQPVLISTPNGVAVLDDGTAGSGSSGMNVGSGSGEEIKFFPTFHYRLVVYSDDTVLRSGSVFGGTAVTLEGEIFMPGATRVLVGGQEVELQGITMDTIQFDTPTSTTTHSIELDRSPFRTLSGPTQGLTVDFFWTENVLQVQVLQVQVLQVQVLQVQVGDAVVWELADKVQELQSLQSVQVLLQSASSNLASATLDDTSFTFSFTFDQIGEFTLSGSSVPQTFSIPSLVVNVTGPHPSFSEVEVYVGPYKAEFVRRSMHTDAKREADMSSMCGPSTPETEGLDSPVIRYSPCLTPVVSYVEPRMGFRLETVFTIHGSRFSEVDSMNIVFFGEYPCTVMSSNDSTIECILDEASGRPTPYVDLPVLVQVTGLGNAYVVSGIDSTIQLQSYVTQISPSAGSVEGGTDIIIYGDGFLLNDSEVTVTLGDLPCTVYSSNYTEIRCTTSDAPSSTMETTVMVASAMQTAVCKDSDGCGFTYSDDHTPKVIAVYPTMMNSTELTIITIQGTGFSDGDVASNIVQFGGISCPVQSANVTFIECFLPPLPATDYPLNLMVCNFTDGRCYGNGLIVSVPNTTVQSLANVISVTPPNGSVLGDTEITINGRGFTTIVDEVEVLIGAVECFVTYVNYTTIVCLTGANEGETYSVQISIMGLSQFPATAQYTYSMDNTPSITGVSPTSGNSGDVITLTGSRLNPIKTVLFGEAECSVISATESEVNCSLGANFVGMYTPEVIVDGVGRAMADSVQFTFTLNVDSLTPTTGSFAGLNPIQLQGRGFYPGNIQISVCDVPCPLSSDVPSLTDLECLIPPMEGTSSNSSSVVTCDIVVETLGVTFTIPGGYAYRGDLTPQVQGVNRTRGGTAGGSLLRISGEGFTGTANVTIAGSVCDVQSQTETEIVCVTGASGRNVRSTIMVNIDGKGYAMSGAEFWYVDLWSSPFTWQGGIIPVAGDFVVVPKGQTLVLDVVTPVLAYILVQGGSLIFDQEKGDNEVELHTQGGLITNDGVFQVGTEAEPFLSKTQIVLYGHVLSTEIPVYGAKTLALRKGILDIHGRQLNTTWTKLARTATNGLSQLYLRKHVDWEVGGTIVIASTSFSQRENEEKVIQSISANTEGSILTLSEPLEYEHISVQQTIGGRYIDTSAEVGYLTRNVVIRGNLNEEWITEAPNCPEVFRPGQFEVQSCFLGRFGAESVNDQFGSQIMIHASVQNQGHVTARFGYVEVTNAGQAFRLGRYPIHYHLNGDVTGSYVRGCGIHHTFNRAVTVHAVDNLLIENNVAFNILGHAFFLEDGIEEHNIIQDNLGVFVRASSSLLNVDITPATFWIVNPNNIVRRNAAAGGTHFGFWYRLPEHPTGPSATFSVCPQHLPVEEFSDNTAHSFGWYGLWVFQNYYPTVTGRCNDNEPAPVYFDRFTAWRNDRGVEFSEVGSLQLRDSIMVDNRFAGVEVTEIEAVWGGEEENGPLIKDTLIVGYSSISEDDFCTESGIKTPKSYFLTVSGVTFANFDRPMCYPIQACSHCKVFQGGFESRYNNISFINEGSNLTKWKWSHEHVHRDLDGSLTKTGIPSLLIPSSEILPTGDCQLHAGSANGEEQGLICAGTLTIGRLAVYNPTPTSLQFTNLNISNEFGTVELPYILKRLRGNSGQMALLVLNQTYDLTWVEGTHLTNISYTILISGFTVNDYVLFRQEYPLPLDYTSIRGITTASNVTDLSNPANAQTGDFYITDNTTLTYIVKGPEELNGEPSLQYSTYRCKYENCIPPPPPTLPPPRPAGRPDVVHSWSDSAIWPNNQLPQQGEDVYINSSLYVILDMPLPQLGTLKIAGAVELLDSIDHQIEADFIIIEGGRLAIGYPDTPFQHKATIVLHGNASSMEASQLSKRDAGTKIGAKALAVFGELILHGETRQPTWTTLAETAMAGADTINVENPVTWVIGDVIVITSTSYDAFESEVFEISEVVNSRTLRLNATLVNTHSGGDFSSLGAGNTYNTRAEVGLLTRSIVITNGDNPQAISESFGCRVLVTSANGFPGSAQIEGVEFTHCGQLGYTDDFDPRFALALLDIEDSYVRSCSFHDGYNTAIGVFDGNGVSVADNVIHGTVGPSVVASGSGHMITQNLASLAQFIGTYRNRVEPLNALWTANFEVTRVSGLTLVGNAAAGGAKAGYHTNGEDCASSTPSTNIRDNIAHSSLHGVHLGYADGHRSGCSRIANFNIFSCYHYGVFSYSLAGIQIVDSVFTNNKAAVYVSVIGPSSLRHMVGTKSVVFERVLVVSSSDEFTCDEDNKTPAIGNHETSHFGLLSRTGGHVGFFIPSFITGHGHFPLAPWFSIISYPAIAGLTEMKQVTFANFHEQCTGKLDVTIMTNRASEDANHPVHLSNISFVSDVDRFPSPVNPNAKLYVHEPRLSRVNPADCVDMDCDGNKEVLLKDLGGSFTQATDGLDRTLISRAEFEWDGDRRRGLGDYRIPRTMLTYPNGSRININGIYPKKGIVRGVGEFADEQGCTFNEAWNMYECKGVDHLMLVLESLDADTEVRRLSPIGMGANGFINLLNGPMDNGWCGGYTCQERISTFYGLVASQLQYTIGLTSTNPQQFGLLLLNANENQGVVVGIIYTNPQRLDVYHNGQYVLPKNAERNSEDNNIKYLTADPNVVNQFSPLISDEAGTNFYDRDTKQLYITVKGDGMYRIETKPVIVLSLTLQVSVEDFFDEVNLVRNLALLLEIPPNRIRVVSVSRETSSRRRKRAEGESNSVMQTIQLEFGDPPEETLTDVVDSGSNTTASGTNTTYTNGSGGGQNITTGAGALNFQELEMLSEKVVEVIQTGEISNALNITANVTSASIEEPVPPPVDETGGVRATPDTGGPQPDAFVNSTAPPTFSEIQLMEEEAEQNATNEVVFSIPTVLAIKFEPSTDQRVVEGVTAQGYAPVVIMLDNNGNVVVNLGLDIPWVVTASIVSSQEGGSFITGASANFTQGQASLIDLVFSHPGVYTLSYTVTLPTTANFGVSSSQSINVLPRELKLLVTQQPSQGNTTFILYPYPQVRLVDSMTGEHIQKHSWRNSTWFVVAKVKSILGSTLIATLESKLINGEATFSDIAITSVGDYKIDFEAYTTPSAIDSLLPSKVSSEQFNVRELPITKLDVVYNVDYNSTIGGDEQSFIDQFRVPFLTAYPNIEIISITLSEGSIIVGVLVTASNPQQLLDLISHATTNANFQSLSFNFNGNVLVPSNITQDMAYPVIIPTSILEQHFVLILATVIPGGVLLISLCALVIVCCAVCRHKKRVKAFKVTVEKYNADDEERYAHAPFYGGRSASPAASSVDEFYLLPEKEVENFETRSFESHELNSLPPTPVNQRQHKISVSEKVHVPATSKVDLHGMMFTNSNTKETNMDNFQRFSTYSTFKSPEDDKDGSASNGTP